MGRRSTASKRAKRQFQKKKRKLVHSSKLQITDSISLVESTNSDLELNSTQGNNTEFESAVGLDKDAMIMDIDDIYGQSTEEEATIYTSEEYQKTCRKTLIKKVHKYKRENEDLRTELIKVIEKHRGEIERIRDFTKKYSQDIVEGESYLNLHCVNINIIYNYITLNCYEICVDVRGLQDRHLALRLFF